MAAKQIMENDDALHLKFIIGSKIYKKTEKDDEVLEKAYKALCKEADESYWVKHQDTIECAKCGFGYFPHDYFFKKHECLKISQKLYIFKTCPDCGRKMKEEVKEA